jgi:transcriptional regulator with XRE-family HTH domain
VVKVLGDNVRTLREHHRLSERQAAMRIASRLDENPGSWRHAIRRIERREVSDLAEEEAEALAHELGVSVEGLGGALLWVWQTSDGWVWSLGTKAIAFSNPRAAFDRRDWLAHISQGKYPTGSIRIEPRLRDELLEELGNNINDPTKRLAEPMLLVDPAQHELEAVTALELVIQGGKIPDGLARRLDPVINLGLATTITTRYVAKLEQVYKPESAEFKKELKRLRILHGLAQKALDEMGAAIAQSEGMDEEKRSQ